MSTKIKLAVENLSFSFEDWAGVRGTLGLSSFFVLLIAMFSPQTGAMGAEESSKLQPLQEIFKAAQPLKVSRGNRPPLFLWGAMDVGTPSDRETEENLRKLAVRGIGAVTTWNIQNKEKSLAEAVRILLGNSRLFL